jgi:hypothetical protein
MMLHPLPAALPPEMWQMLLDAWRGNPVDKIEVAHAAWHAIGYGISRFDPNHPPMFASGPDELPPHDEVARILESASSSSRVAAAAREHVNATIPWNVIVIVAWEIIKRVFK